MEKFFKFSYWGSKVTNDGSKTNCSEIVSRINPAKTIFNKVKNLVASKTMISLKGWKNSCTAMCGVSHCMEVNHEQMGREKKEETCSFQSMVL